MVDAHLVDAASSPPSHHEVIAAFAAHGLPLNATLVEMLDEHFTHRTERRGCGYTQATRHLADLINRPPTQHREAVIKLFARDVRGAIEPEAAAAVVTRIADELSAPPAREESGLLARLIVDVVQRAAAGPPVLPPWFDEIKVGTCPLAEKYFLEIADRFVRRKGRANVIVSDAGEPLLVEKLHLGDTHSCISVTELVLHGVRLPAGCLFGVKYPGDDDAVPALRPNRALPGDVIPVGRLAGFRFLRLTTLAVSPANRARAFTTHFQAQVDAPLYRPAEATIAELRAVALEQL